MKITESKLRQMIREVIQEISAGSTTLGKAKPKGHKSADTKSKEASYDTKSAKYDSKLANYNTKKGALDDYAGRKYVDRTGTSFSATAAKGFRLNSAWTTKSNEKDTAETEKHTAETAKDSAETTRDTAREADLKKTVPTQEPPTGGASGGFGKGKSAGKGKGKGKKKKN